MLWIGVAASLLVLAGIALIALRPTTVRVIPRSHAILFDSGARFIAYSAEGALPGTLGFTLATSTIEDSELLSTTGTENVEERAQGIVTIYNEYSAQSVKLIKNTRFQTPDGLVFRIPAEVLVPGKKGTSPGSIEVTVVAEAPGEKYNVGPISRFTIPGLRSTPDMYSKVYARSTTGTTGGFSGNRPKLEPSALESARSAIRARIGEKVQATATTLTSPSTFAFPGLARVTYEELSPTTESKGLRIGERARIGIPVFAADQFAHAIAESVSAEAEQGTVYVK
ncbi:baseplate J/gp47 family protein, partial [Candidatus Uhrbacteria bacterium]|nr:baseplate J/gp47 family protein [Candidatus Uhrbacteria bacterium]